MTKASETDEHILVCISPSPSNPKVIAAAAKMADAFHAVLTAIYVRPTDYASLPEEDKARLQNNIKFAEQKGASVTTVIGDDVPVQVAEYAHISNTTKIVVGRSGFRRRHFWSRTPLTEQIILNAPDVDVYIIPDSAVDFKRQKERFHIAGRIRPTAKDFFITVLILAMATGIGLLFTQFGFSESNIITVFILGVLAISVITVSPLYGAIGSLSSVLLFNWVFIEPKFSFHTYEAEYPVTFAIMLLSSLITGTLANKIKRNASQDAREAFRTKVLLDTNQLLQKAEKADEIMRITARQIIMLSDRDVVIFPRVDPGRPGESSEAGAGHTITGSASGADYVFHADRGILGDGSEYGAAAPGGDTAHRDADEKEMALWAFRNHCSCGFRTDQYSDAKSQYHAVCLNDYCYGVIAIRLNSVPLEPFEHSILMSILGECALALENLRNAEEKEMASVIARNEQLRSNLLRSISHDIRTPLTSISGNADTLLSHYRELDDGTLEQIFSDIYDDSEWLIDLVENLLSISRIENGQMNLHLSLEIMSDVIEEALKHIDKKAGEHRIAVQNTDDILLVSMDTRLIMQVLINLVNNAVKNTPPGSEICIRSRQAGEEAVVMVLDNGPGIPDDIKPHIFEMFYTAPNMVADGRRGLGLGLALCKSIVEAHGGRITLTDNIPSGCCFTFSLPISEVQINE